MPGSSEIAADTDVDRAATAGGPPVQDWAAGVAVTEPQGPVCAVRRCPLVASPADENCRAHRSR